MFPVIALIGAGALYASPVGARPLRRAHWVAVWIAPNAGLAIFWVLAGLLVVGLVVATVRTRGRARLTGLALVVALLIVTGTLASWYAPFGWIAWGPRLMLPALPAVTLTVLVLYAPGIERLLRRLLATGLRTAVWGLLLIALAPPEVNILHAPYVAGDLFTPDQACPTSPSVGDPSYYYHCIDHYAWGRHWLLLSSFRALNGTWGIVFAVAFAAIWATLIGFIHGRVSAAARAAEPISASVASARWRGRSAPGSAAR